MNVVVKEPGKKIKKIAIKNDLESLQELIGGYIECVPLDEDITIICDEEGKLKGLQPNIDIEYDIICGTVVFVGNDGEDFRSLTPGEVAYLEVWTFANEVE